MTERPDATVPSHTPQRAETSSDEELVKSLYADYAGPLLGFVVRLTGGDRQWAEDVVQETLLRAWRNADKLDPGARTLRPWLSTVARRIVIDERRSRQARPAETGQDTAPTEAFAVNDQSERLVQEMAVTAALNSLSVAHREVLVETYFRDRTVHEAAQALDLPVGTVKSRIYYALRGLRRAFAEQGVTS